MGKFSTKEQYFPATTPFVFRVPIRTPTRAKIASVAAHRRQQLAAAAASTQSNNSELQSGMIGMNGGMAEGSTNTMKPSTSIDQLLAKPNIQDELRRELEELNKYSELIKKDIKTLSNIRGNVLWLLKKVTYANTLKNHKTSNK